MPIRAAPPLWSVVRWLLATCIGGALVAYRGWSVVASIALATVMPTALYRVALAINPQITHPAPVPLVRLHGRKKPRKRARSRPEVQRRTAGGGARLAHTRHRSFKQRIMAFTACACLLGAIGSTAAGTANLLGPEGCEVTVHGLEHAGLIACHLPRPSALVESNMPAGAQEMIGDHLHTK